MALKNDSDLFLTDVCGVTSTTTYSQLGLQILPCAVYLLTSPTIYTQSLILFARLNLCVGGDDISNAALNRNALLEGICSQTEEVCEGSAISGVDCTGFH
jgi:hypothetical protein